MNAFSWLTWLIFTLTTISSTRNPFYLSLIWLGILLVCNSSSLPQSQKSFPFSLVKLTFFMIGAASGFNLLTTHFGDTQIGHIPGEIPLVSGPVTLEAAVYGAINGLVLSCILASFTVFNRALSVRALISLIPRVFYPLAIVISIAMTFIPSTQQQFAEIREAQLLRGHRVSGIKSLAPIVMPLLISSLERSLMLAEAMTARGFASQSGDQRHSLNARAVLLAGLLGMLSGWIVRIWPETRPTGAGLLILGMALIFGSLAHLNHKTEILRHPKHVWSARDTAALAMIGSTTMAWLLWVKGAVGESLNYSPYTMFKLPLFHPLIGIFLLVIALPAFLQPQLS